MGGSELSPVTPGASGVGTAPPPAGEAPGLLVLLGRAGRGAGGPLAMRDARARTRTPVDGGWGVTGSPLGPSASSWERVAALPQCQGLELGGRCRQRLPPPGTGRRPQGRGRAAYEAGRGEMSWPRPPRRGGWSVTSGRRSWRSQAGPNLSLSPGFGCSKHHRLEKQEESSGGPSG